MTVHDSDHDAEEGSTVSFDGQGDKSAQTPPSGTVATTLANER